MVAPVIGALALPALGKATKTIGEALTADLAVVKWSYQPRARRKVKPAPVDMELHVNPAAIGVAAVGVGLTMWLLQLRANPVLVSVEMGRWYWPSAGQEKYDPPRYAFPEVSKAKRGPTPTRIVYGDRWVPEQGHWYLPHGPGTREQIWVVDSPAHYEKQQVGYEDAMWETSASKTKKTLSVERRPGFSMSGLLDIPVIGGGDEPWYEKWPFLWWL